MRNALFSFCYLGFQLYAKPTMWASVPVEPHSTSAKPHYNEEENEKIIEILKIKVRYQSQKVKDF